MLNAYTISVVGAAPVASGASPTDTDAPNVVVRIREKCCNKSLEVIIDLASIWMGS